MRKAALAKEDLEQLFWSDLDLISCSRIFRVDTTRLRNEWVLLFGAEAYRERKRRLKKAATSGVNNYQVRWKTEGRRHWGNKSPEERKTRITRQGYHSIGTPEWYESDSPYTLEHIVVYCKHHGLKRIPDGHIIHHKDGDKLNNDISNLEMMTRSEHINHHRKDLQGSTTIPKGSTQQAMVVEAPDS